MAPRRTQTESNAASTSVAVPSEQADLSSVPAVETAADNPLIAELLATVNALKAEVSELKAKPTGLSAPSFGTARFNKQEQEWENYCLVLYKHDAAPDQNNSMQAQGFPLEVPGPMVDGKPTKDIRMLDLVPGIQAIPKEHRDQLFEPRFAANQPYIDSGVLQPWEETWDLRIIAERDPIRAIETIARTTKRNMQLLRTWAKDEYFLYYPEAVQRRLLQKREELQGDAQQASNLFETKM